MGGGIGVSPPKRIGGDTTQGGSDPQGPSHLQIPTLCVSKLYTRSNRSAFMTFVHAEMKSLTNFSPASAEA